MVQRSSELYDRYSNKAIQSCRGGIYWISYFWQIMEISDQNRDTFCQIASDLATSLISTFKIKENFGLTASVLTTFRSVNKRPNYI